MDTVIVSTDFLIIESAKKDNTSNDNTSNGFISKTTLEKWM